ncbi:MULTISPECIES: MarR family winged helix-turn-helix transcriptional regulator [Planobispora]|uniref:MarR family transcriptional regulator n=2 Tax=Planobispora TaxID=29298 RepID=A0A8J3WEU8_PLARO|nr:MULTISPECIES: MarR family transcriptional regulator [Planobispora]BFE84024.1 MarR family transcriptional regulator [Planobispora longispora]GGS72771.1 MarR family transcriptional regulator [Planobispora rosea]GIH78487.1 MarR family transcriptional regulator [Planobispora longispora]GIH85321.1 MarR family transcriptional regulator [Planobispora rosea]
MSSPRKDPVANLRSDAGLASALRVSLARLTRRLRRQGTGHSLTPTQVATLVAVEQHSGITPGELAEHEKVQPPSMTRVIAALEERGLVSRTPHPTDRRQVTVSVTAEGSALLKEERRRREAWLTQRLKELTPEERAVLRQAAPILEKLSRI